MLLWRSRNLHDGLRTTQVYATRSKPTHDRTDTMVFSIVFCFRTFVSFTERRKAMKLFVMTGHTYPPYSKLFMYKSNSQSHLSRKCRKVGMENFSSNSGCEGFISFFNKTFKSLSCLRLLVPRHGRFFTRRKYETLSNASWREVFEEPVTDY